MTATREGSVLVTGAAGCIGAQVVANLARDGQVPASRPSGVTRNLWKFQRGAAPSASLRGAAEPSVGTSQTLWPRPELSGFSVDKP